MARVIHVSEGYWPGALITLGPKGWGRFWLCPLAFFGAKADSQPISYPGRFQLGALRHRAPRINKRNQGTVGFALEAGSTDRSIEASASASAPIKPTHGRIKTPSIGRGNPFSTGSSTPTASLVRVRVSPLLIAPRARRRSLVRLRIHGPRSRRYRCVRASALRSLAKPYPLDCALRR